VSTTGHPVEVFPRLGGIGGLPEGLPVEDDIGVAGNDNAIRGRNRLGLHASVLDHLDVGIAAGQLLDVGHDYLELDPELLQDLPPLGRARR
jgi:hypothetical protein